MPLTYLLSHLGKKACRRLALVMSILIIAAVAAGCQTINGLDLNQVLIKHMQVNSFAGQGSIEVSFDLDKNAKLTKEEQGELDAANRFLPLKLDLTDIRMQDQKHAYLKGSVVMPKGSIPFELTWEDPDYYIKLADAGKPVKFSVASIRSEMMGSVLAAGQDGAADSGMKAVLGNKELIQSMESFLVKHLPNPKNIGLESVTDTINGQSVTLQKVHAEVNGTELTGLLKNFILAVMQDDQGLKELLGQVYDAIQPALDAARQQHEQQWEPGDQEDQEDQEDQTDEDSLFGSLGDIFGNIDSLMADRVTAIEFMHTEVKQVLVMGLAMLNNGKLQGDEDMNPLQDPRTKGAVDVYVDQSLNVRKLGMELTVGFPAGMESYVTALHMKEDLRLWDVNQPVKLENKVEKSDAVELHSEEALPQLLKLAAPGSTLHEVLLNDLHVLRNSTYIYVGDPDFIASDDTNLPYAENGTVMVPLSFMDDRLHTVHDWSKDSGSARVTDTWTDVEVQFEVGKSTADVNGKTLQLAKPVVVRGDEVYVPLRALADAFGYQVKWESSLQLVMLTRD